MILNNKLIFCTIIFLEVLLLSHQLDFDSNANCKAILVNNKIIYIIDLDNNNNIYLYDSSQNRGNSIGTVGANGQLITNKRILNLKDNKFIIIGLRDNDYFYYGIYEFTGSSTNLQKREPTINLKLSTLRYFEGKYISNLSQNRIILSVNIGNIFKIYMLNLDSGTYQEKTIEDIEYINQDTYFKRNIDCDSSDGNNFLCIFCYKGDDIWKLFYITGEFDTNIKNTGSVCDDCFLGNIIRENQSANRYLVCYQRKSNTLLYIVCQYYTYNEGRLIIGNTYEVGQLTGDYYDNKPLILYKHESSIFIIFNYSSNNVYFSISILCSLDLKINILSIIHTGKSVITMDSFNDNDYFYSLYEETDNDNINKSTKLIMFQLKQCHATNSIIISDDVNDPINFGYEHSGQIISFSLDTKILLYRDKDKGIIVSPNGNYITLENNEKFKFEKLEETGVFDNYYCYMNKNENKLYQFLSLICKITVTICYPTCKSCNPNKISSSEEHLCKECKGNFFPLNVDADKAEHNCYSSSDSQVTSYYKENKNNKIVFSPCNSSCKTCDNANSCKICKDGYYFKYENNDIKSNDICYTSNLENYYLDYNSINKVYNGVTIKTVYKLCYDSCSSCIGQGTYENNKCIECKIGKIKYKFNDYQCLQDKQICINDNKYWEIKNNNINCLDSCDQSIILYGENKGLCVDDCLNYINPYSTMTNYFTLIDCGGKNYCIPFNICLNGHFNYNIERSECVRIGECEIDIFDNDDPFEHDDDPITDDISEHITPDDKIDDINKRFKVFKMFRESKKYTSWHYFDSQLIQNYIRLLKKELENYDNSEIYLITTTEYDNFTITIYPIDIEEFVYNQIFIPNNLGFVNFTNTFKNYIDYEINKKCLILILLFESHSSNSSINDINYYFYALNEKKDDGNNEIKINEDTYLASKDSLFEISYPLYNYHNNNSNINKRNSEILVDNIKSMYYKYPNIEIFNLTDPFYNDICSLYTSEVNTDMSLNDRRKEYYVNQTLCENNCYLIKILNKDLKNPRSLCNCKKKSEFMFNNKTNINYSIPEISSYNSKAVKCISETFNKNSISSNPIFWIFILVMIFLIILLIRWIFYGKKEINRILQLYRQNPEDSNIKISENSELNDISNIDNKENSKKNKLKKIDKNKDLARSMIIKDNRVQNSNNAIESQQAEYLSAPINQSAPPKRKIQKVTPNILTKDEYRTDDKDLISNSEPSMFRNSNKPNEKDNTDISFENVPYDNQIYVDNLLKQRKMMENNYLKNPVEYEKFQKMQILRDSLYNLEDFEQKKYCNTCEDIYCPKDLKKKGNSKKNEKNKFVMKLLDAESLFDKENNPFFNNNLSDNNDEENLQKDKDKNKDNNNINSSFFKDEKFEGDEQFFFPGGIFGKDGENLLLTNDINSQKYGKNKNINKKKRKFNEKNEDNKNNYNESDNENNNEKNIINDNKTNKKNNNTKNKNNSNSNNHNSSNDKNNNNINQNNSNNQNSSSNKNNNKNKKNNNIKKNKGKDTSKTINANARNNLMRSLGKNNFYEEENNEEKKDEKNENYNEKLKTEYDQDVNNIIKAKLKKIACGEDNSEEGIFNKYKNTLISDDKNNNKLKKSYNSNVLKIKSKKNKAKDNRHNKNDSSRESNSNRKMINFQHEIEKEGDMGVPITDSNILKNKNKNNEDDISDKISVDKKSNEIKSDFEMFKNKILASSVSAFINTEENKPILVEENFFLFYWRYFKKRELCLVCFKDKNDTMPYFVRWSCFVFCLIFIFLLSCLFFFESNVHQRYINALSGKKNSLGYYFKNEFSNSFFVALISIIFKMIIIKIVLYRLLKIKKDEKKMMKPSSEKGLDEIELEELQNKRNKFLRIYKIKLIVYFVSLMVLSILFSYFCICYGGVFRNSISAFLLGFLFSSILTFILCALICLIIVSIYRLAKHLKNKCLLSTYIVLSTLY